MNDRESCRSPDDLMKNNLLLNRTFSVFVANGQDVLPDAYVGAALRNIERLGFTFSKELIERVRTLSEEVFVPFYQELISVLQEMVGDKVVYRPFYPNFPQQVQDMPELALYINAILHYVTNETPDFEVKERFPLIQSSSLLIIQLAEEAAYEKLLSNLFGSQTSLSPSDKADISTVIERDEQCLSYLPTAFTHKENMAFIVSSLLKHNRFSVKESSAHIRTATDVLRLAVAMSEGDVSLAQPSRFRQFKRKERRFFLELLERILHVDEDMVRYRNRWIRLGEILHPREYASRYPKANAAFRKLRNNERIETFASKVEEAILERDVQKAVSLLVTRPGELARRVDHLIRLSLEKGTSLTMVVDALYQVAPDLSTPVLLQLMTHFKSRENEQSIRTFFPKGNVSKVFSLTETLPPLPIDICLVVAFICEQALKSRFASLEPLGKVYVEEDMQNFMVPFSQRSASKALHTVVRGSRLDLPDADTLRFFLYWKEGLVNGVHTDQVDIDLSAVFFDENWSFIDVVSYYNLSEHHLGAYHSGDIVTAPNGASEFIDVDIPKVIEQKGRYVVMSLNSFSEQFYKDLPECFAGWMSRENPLSGEVYEPSTVENKLDVTADTTISVPVIFDLVERKAIWCDLSLTQNLSFSNHVDANKQTMAIVGKAITTLQKPNLYDLFRIHAEARGEVVDSKEEADISFATKGDVTPFHIESIMSDYIA